MNHCGEAEMSWRGTRKSKMPCVQSCIWGGQGSMDAKVVGLDVGGRARLWLQEPGSGPAPSWHGSPSQGGRGLHLQPQFLPHVLCSTSKKLLQHLVPLPSPPLLHVTAWPGQARSPLPSAVCCFSSPSPSKYGYRLYYSPPSKPYSHLQGWSRPHHNYYVPGQ